jgi:hypothetical protein
MPDEGQTFLNHYESTSSKELLVRKAMADGLPTTITDRDRRRRLRTARPEVRRPYFPAAFLRRQLGRGPSCWRH